MAINAANKNPYIGQTFDATLGEIQKLAKQNMDALLSVANVAKDPKTGRDVVPATDPSGLLTLALAAFRSKYATSIREYSSIATGDAVDVVKTKVRTARTSMRTALKNMQEAAQAMDDCLETLAMTKQRFEDKQSEDAIALQLEAAEKRTKAAKEREEKLRATAERVKKNKTARKTA